MSIVLSARRSFAHQRPPPPPCFSASGDVDHTASGVWLSAMAEKYLNRFRRFRLRCAEGGAPLRCVPHRWSSRLHPSKRPFNGRVVLAIPVQRSGWLGMCAFTARFECGASLVNPRVVALGPCAGLAGSQDAGPQRDGNCHERDEQHDEELAIRCVVRRFSVCAKEPVQDTREHGIPKASVPAECRPCDGDGPCGNRRCSERCQPHANRPVPKDRGKHKQTRAPKRDHKHKGVRLMVWIHEGPRKAGCQSQHERCGQEGELLHDAHRETPRTSVWSSRHDEALALGLQNPIRRWLMTRGCMVNPG